MLGFEPRTFRMQSERSTTELHPHLTACQDQRDKIASVVNESLAYCILFIIYFRSRNICSDSTNLVK